MSVWELRLREELSHHDRSQMSSLAEESATLVPQDKLSVGDPGEGVNMVTRNTETDDGDREENKDGKGNGNDGGAGLGLESYHDKAVKEMEKLEA